VPRVYIDQGIHHTIAIMNSKSPLPINSSSSSNAISARYPLNAICEWSPVVVAEAIDTGECEIAKDSNVSAADVVIPPQNPAFDELRHDRLCTTIVSSLDDLDIDAPVHRSSPPKAANTNTLTQEDDVKLPVWKKKRVFVGICLILVFIGTLVAFVAFATPSSKEADEPNTVNSGNIRGTAINHPQPNQSSQVTSRRSGLPPIVEDKMETPTDDESALASHDSSNIGTNTTTTKTWDIEHELDQYDADSSDVEPGDYYSSNSRDGSWTWNNDGYKSDEP